MHTDILSSISALNYMLNSSDKIFMHRIFVKLRDVFPESTPLSIYSLQEVCFVKRLYMQNFMGEFHNNFLLFKVYLLEVCQTQISESLLASVSAVE
jgi:hypothetical protein